MQGIPMNFRTRILLSYLLLFAISMATLIGYLYWSTTAGKRESVVLELRENAVRILDDLAGHIHNHRMELLAMSTARVWYDDSPADYLQERIASYRGIYSIYDRVTLFGKDGRIIADSDRAAIGTVDKCLCWQNGMGGKSGFHVVAAKAQHDSSIHYYQGIRNSTGRLATVLAIRIPLSHIMKHVRGFPQFPASNQSTLKIELVDEDGRLLYSNRTDSVIGDKAAALAELRQLTGHLTKTSDDSSVLEQDGKVTILAISRQKEVENHPIPWIMRVQIDKEQIFADIRKHRDNIALFTLAMMGISGSLIWLVAARLTRPVKELAELAVEMSRGRFESIRELPARSDELGCLVESMRSMGSRLDAALEELKEREEKFKTVADFTINWEYWIAPEGEFLYISPSCQRISGYAAEEFRQRPELLTEIIHPEDRPMFIQHLAGALHEPDETTTTHEELEFRIVTKGAETRWLSHVCRPIFGAEGAFLGRRASNFDITDRKKYEELIRSLNAGLEAKVLSRTAELESSVRDLEGFCYAVSHEIRAPLARLEGFSQALKEESSICGNEQHCFYAGRLVAASRQLQEVIDGLLLFTRLPRLAIIRQQVDLSGMATCLAAELMADRQEQAVDFAITPGITVSADPELIRLCLRILMDNAVKFSSISPSARVEFGINSEEGKEVFFVRDNGAGFDMRFSGKLFAPFQRLHSHKNFAGIGIGLATAKRIIERHGGSIWADSRPGEGATFFFSLSNGEEIKP